MKNGAEVRMSRRYRGNVLPTRSIHFTGMERRQEINGGEHLDTIKTEPAAALVHAVEAIGLNAA